MRRTTSRSTQSWRSWDFRDGGISLRTRTKKMKKRKSKRMRRQRRRRERMRQN